MATTIEAAKAFCHHRKSAFAFDPIVLKHMADFSDEQNKSLALKVREMEAAIKTVLSHFESHQVCDKGSEAILREVLNADG